MLLPQLESLEHRRLLSGVPALSISDVSVGEGHAGATACTFTVLLSKRSSNRVSVRFTTTSGSAKAGDDFARVSGTLKFARGERIRTVTVMVAGDSAVEADETFTVKLRDARNAFIRDAKGVGRILNDDVLPPPPPVPPPSDPPPWEEPYGDGNWCYCGEGPPPS